MFLYRGPLNTPSLIAPLLNGTKRMASAKLVNASSLWL